ncbi:MAG: hypothetical protein V4525_14005 [Pseudomonadota bacterium]
MYFHSDWLIFLYPIIKLGCYCVWCSFGFYWLNGVKAAVYDSFKLGLIRWGLGVAVGFTVAVLISHLRISNYPQHYDLIRNYQDYRFQNIHYTLKKFMYIYTPLRFLEWGFIVYLIRRSTKHVLSFSQSTAFNFILGGIFISFITDFVLNLSSANQELLFSTTLWKTDSFFENDFIRRAVYPIMKFFGYTLWSAVGLYYFNEKNFSFWRSIRLGFYRLFLGIIFGFLVYLFITIKDTNHLVFLVFIIYTPIRIIEWAIVLKKIVGDKANNIFFSQQKIYLLSWIFFGIIISFLTDLYLPGGMFSGDYNFGDTIKQGHSFRMC